MMNSTSATPKSGAESDQTDDDQLTLFDVEPHEKRYIEAPSWPEPQL